MKFCINCGAQLADEAKFCVNCGAQLNAPASGGNPDDGKGLEPDAPDDVITSELETKAPDDEGEFTGVSWSEPKSKKRAFVKDSELPQQPQQPIQAQQPQQPIQAQQPQQPIQAQQPQQQPMPPQQQWQQQPQQQPMPPQQQWQQPQQQQWQQQPQQQWPQQQRPTEDEEKRGPFSNKWLIALLALIPIAIGAALLFKGGGSESEPGDYKTGEPETTEQIQQSNHSQESEESQPNEQQAQGASLTLDKITSMIAQEYDEYVVDDRMTVEGSEACIIIPKGASDRSNRLVLRLYADELKGINGITNEEIGDLLSKIVDANAGVIAKNVKTEKPYKVHYDDNADGSYLPHCYTYINWKDGKGIRSWSYGEATLIDRSVLSGVAVATDEAELRALCDIYMEVVQVFKQ